MGVRLGVVVFPGSNCDHDAYHVARHVFDVEARFIWHKDTDLEGVDAVIVPGGFSYGDYLRAGAIARFSPIMRRVAEFAAAGGAVLGVCNGFQILCECGLLPGVLLRNASLRFVCRWVHVRVEQSANPFMCALEPGTVLQIPVAHGEGNYFAGARTLTRLAAQDQVALRYCQPDGSPGGNPNGSVDDIAGITNAVGNVLGMMPHPERCAEDVLGSSDGGVFFTSLLSHITGAVA